jgi:signal transduction histidine kinase
MPAPLPINETERLRALREYNILDTLPEQEYQDIVQLAALICGTPIALVSLVDADRQWFKAKVGIDASQTPREAAFCAHALLQPDELLLVPDARRDPRFADNPLVTDAPNIHFYAGAPLKTSEGHVLGTLCVVDTKPRELTPVQQEALFALSRQVISQLDIRVKLNELEQAQNQLREVAAHQDRIKEEERTRIAREIHDELGGVMTGIKSYLSFAIDRAQRAGLAADPHLVDASALTDSAIDTVRRVITDLRPSVLDQLGIWAALEWYAGQFTARTGLPCRVHIADDIDDDSMKMDSALSTALFRIVQETLTNVSRHAAATSVHLQVRREPDGVVVRIRDNGRGIAAADLLKTDSWGIAGIYERARYFGGNVDIVTHPDGGTLVVVKMPLVHTDAA